MTPQNAASHLGLFCLHREILSKNEIKIKIIPNTPKNVSGLMQLIMMGESIRQIWINEGSYKHMETAKESGFKLQIYVYASESTMDLKLNLV